MQQQTQDKSLTQLIVELEQRYQEENVQSELFQRLYHQQNEQDSSTSAESLLKGSTHITSPNNSNPTRILPKHIKKGRKANIKKQKNLNHQSQEANSLSDEQPKRHIIDNSITDKKQLQMIRNRISAQNSRDRKKAYLQQLETDYERQALQIQTLQETIAQLQQQLEYSQQTSSYYQQQLQNQVCMSCGSKNIGYAEDLPKKNRGLTNLGLSFLVIFTIMALMVSSNTSTSQTLKEIQEPTYIIRELNDTNPEYYLYQTIIENQSKGITDIMEYNSEFNYKFTTDTSYRQMINEGSTVSGLINFNKERAKRQESGRALAPLDYNQPQIDSLYCPTTYKYQKIQDIQVTNNQWLHLVVPKDNFNIFYESDKNQITLREYQGKSQAKPSYSEIWCRVKSINDIYE